MQKLEFKGDIGSEDDVYAFIHTSLPNLPNPIHEELTEFMLDRHFTLSPTCRNILNQQEEVQEIVEAIMEKKFKSGRRLIQTLECILTHQADEIASFIYRVGPDIPSEQREVVTRYTHCKLHKMQCSQEDEQFVAQLCARRPELADLLSFLCNDITRGEFTRRHGDIL